MYKVYEMTNDLNEIRYFTSVDGSFNGVYFTSYEEAAEEAEYLNACENYETVFINEAAFTNGRGFAY